SRRDFASEKFAIIQRILPKLAEKTSHLVGKPVPDLTPVITRIMDIVNVECPLESDGKGVRAKVEVTNYTPRPRVLELFVEIPPDVFPVAAFDPAPDGVDAPLGRAWWTLPKLAPNGRTGLTVSFPAKTDVDSNDLDWYVAGIDEAPEAAAADAAANGTSAEEEVDYDAAEASAHASEEE